MKDTVRVIMFLECNFKCRYCCNDKEKFSQLFLERYLFEIDFTNYMNVCITGGEPFLRKDVLWNVMDAVPADKPIFMYTNGILITDEDIDRMHMYNIQGINVGMHGLNQPKLFNPRLDEFSTRYVAWDKYKKQYLGKYPQLLKEENTKFWQLDNCLRPNEDWILLRDFEEGYGKRLPVQTLDRLSV